MNKECFDYKSFINSLKGKVNNKIMQRSLILAQLIYDSPDLTTYELFNYLDKLGYIKKNNNCLRSDSFVVDKICRQEQNYIHIDFDIYSKEKNLKNGMIKVMYFYQQEKHDYEYILIMYGTKINWFKRLFSKTHYNFCCELVDVFRKDDMEN